MTIASRSLSPQPFRTLSERFARRGLVAAIILFAAVAFSAVLAIGVFPASWNWGLRGPIDQFEHWVIGNRAGHPLFVYGFTPFSKFIDGILRFCEQFLLGLPWITVVLAVALIAYKARGVLLAMVSAVALMLVAAVGLWEQSLRTLA